MLDKLKMFVTAKRPEILLVGGLISIGAGVVLACNASRHVDEELEASADAISCAKTDLDGVTSDIAIRKEKALCAWKLFRMYAPGVSLIACGTGMIIKSHKDMYTRLEGVSELLSATAAAFGSYRGRVKNELGVDYDRHFMYGTKSSELEIPEWREEDGTIHAAENRIYSDTIEGDYAFSLEFDENSAYWDEFGGDATLIMGFLNQTNNKLENELVAKGYLFNYRIKEETGYRKDITAADYVNGFTYKGRPKDGPDGSRVFDLNLFSAYDRARRLEREGYARRYLLIPTSYGKTSTYILEDFEKCKR